MSDVVTQKGGQFAFSAGHHATKSKTVVISSCAAMKCGLASRKILTNAAPVLPIRIDRHSLDSAASTPPLRCADRFAVVEAQD